MSRAVDPKANATANRSEGAARKAAAPDAPYTLRSIEAMLGLRRSAIAGLIDAGVVTPRRGARNELRFSFQDVVLLRTAHELRSADIGARRLLRALRQLKARLPHEMPLSGLRIQAVGNDVVVRESGGGAPWAAHSGQLLMDFELAPSRGKVEILSRTPQQVDAPAQAFAPGRRATRNSVAASASASSSADEWFDRGEQLEPHDLCAAEAAYRKALTLAPGHCYACLNLGALLCESGRHAEAAALFQRGLEHHPDEPLLHFNHAVALEELGRGAEALARYERSLQLAPDLADAHFNAARLYRERGEPQRALRHWSAYRRLTRRG